MEDLKNRTFVVTGAASGLGECITRTLLEAGAFVVPTDYRLERLQEVCSAIEGAQGRIKPMQLDVGDERRAQEVLESAVQAFGSLDGVVNNAGIDKTVSIEELSFAEWDRILTTNLRGPFVLSKLAFPILKRQGGGAIVNIASSAAKRAWANACAYHASKWGLLGFSHALHVEGRAYNIKVSAVVTGGMKTPFLLDRFPDIDVSTLQNPMNVAKVVLFVLNQPAETVIPEVIVLPMRETSWP